MNWCRDLKSVRGKNKAVLWVICDKYNDKFGYAWPSIARIAKDSGWSDRTVSRALRWLEEREYVATFEQRYARDNSQASNRYYLPQFGEIPRRGTVFILQGDFDFNGIWDASSTTESVSLTPLEVNKSRGG